MIDWQGKPYTPGNGPAAHPNSRFTVSAKQNPIYSSLAEAPEGVPISAILFGGRRREVAPLVYEARDWAHGVLVGAGMASETTAAAVGQMGVVRRDSMAMKPFCGYNFADYWKHWLRSRIRRRSCRASSTSIGSARTRTASSCGRATAITSASCAGLPNVAKARSAPSKHRSGTCPGRRIWTRMASTSTAQRLQTLLSIDPCRLASRARIDRKVPRRVQRARAGVAAQAAERSGAEACELSARSRLNSGRWSVVRDEFRSRSIGLPVVY